MKVVVYTITKNEESFISRWASSASEADYLLVVDTGSTDGTALAAREAGCDVARISVSPWRFDDARNASLTLLPQDADLCIALDADEILIPGWRKALESLPPEVTRPRYKYVWSWNQDGTEGLVYSGDKIHSRSNYRWVHPVHEVLTCTGSEVQMFCPGLEIHHYPDPSKSRSQYLPLLEVAVSERPDDDRNQFYLGREYMFHGRHADAERHLLRHLELSKWRAERATAMRYLARVTADREGWLMKACGEAPDRREPWIDLARFHYESQNWSLCLASCERALAIKDKPLEYLCEADAWGALPYDLASVACWNLGLLDKAESYCAKALRESPNDERIASNYRLIAAGISSSRDC